MIKVNSNMFKKNLVINKLKVVKMMLNEKVPTIYDAKYMYIPQKY